MSEWLIDGFTEIIYKQFSSSELHNFMTIKDN